VKCHCPFKMNFPTNKLHFLRIAQRQGWTAVLNNGGGLKGTAKEEMIQTANSYQYFLDLGMRDLYLNVTVFFMIKCEHRLQKFNVCP
jgi:hypothetical protein